MWLSRLPWASIHSGLFERRIISGLERRIKMTPYQVKRECFVVASILDRKYGTLCIEKLIG